MNSNDFVDVYKVKLGLTHDMLGTNPISLQVMDEHIIDRQRKLIAENSTVNRAINKYLGAKDINYIQVKFVVDTSKLELP